MDTEFNNCVNIVNNNKNNMKIPENVAADFYKFYKQATIGDCNINKPSMFDFIGSTKWNAWNGIKGMTTEEAKLNYINLFRSVF
jgi:acyl-CoA-binding protein